MMPKQQQQRRGSNASVLQMIQMLDMQAASMQDEHAALLLQMAAKALAQLQSHGDRVTAEAVHWQDEYEQMEHLYQEQVEKNVDLDEENGLLLFKCQQLEAADERLLNEQCCAPVPDQALLEAAPRCLTPTKATSDNSFSFSDDIYGQLDQFEHSLNMELEDLQELESFGSSSVASMASQVDSESAEALSPCCEVIVSDTPCMVSPLQDKTMEASKNKDTPSAPNMNPLQLFQRMFITQADDEPMPAMTTSDSMFSLSSDCSFSAGSGSSDLFSVTPLKKTIRNSPQPNAEWAIIE